MKLSKIEMLLKEALITESHGVGEIIKYVTRYENFHGTQSSAVPRWIGQLRCTRETKCMVFGHFQNATEIASLPKNGGPHFMIHDSVDDARDYIFKIQYQRVLELNERLLELSTSVVNASLMLNGIQNLGPTLPTPGEKRRFFRAQLH